MDIINQPYIILLLLASSGVLLWLIWPPQNGSRRHTGRVSTSRKALQKFSRSRAYRGVTVCGGQCEAARMIAGRKFSFDRAPALPLAGCDSRRCRCRYQGLVESRQTNRRDRMNRRQTDRLDATHPDRRSGRDRRRSAIAWKDPASHVGSLSVGLE